MKMLQALFFIRINRPVRNDQDGNIQFYEMIFYRPNILSSSFFLKEV